MQRKPWSLTTVCLSVLFGLNLLIFCQHYLNYAIFPWDFPLSYYTVPYYWISSIQHGQLPHWIAQQAMGYPLLMNLQSGFNYPIFWLFVVFNKAFTLHAAVVLQCLTIFGGGAGCFFLGRLLHFSPVESLFFGISYMFFGGFIGNAEHPDIIRGYAFLPWLMYVLYPKNAKLFSRLIVLLPLLTFCFLGGAYLGMIIAAAVILPIWWASILFKEKPIKQYFCYLSLAIFLAILIAIYIYAIPSLLLSEIDRAAKFNTVDHSYFSHSLLPTLIFNFKNLQLPNDIDISMRSYFINCAMLVGFLLFNNHTIKANFSWLIMLFSGLFFSSGLIHLKLLDLSRFPISDYKAFIIIPLLIIAVNNYKNVEINTQNKTIEFIKNAVIVGLIVTGLYYYANSPIYDYIASNIFSLAALLSVILVAKKRLFLTLTIIASINCLYYWLSQERTWYDGLKNDFYKTNYNINFEDTNITPKQTAENVNRTRAYRPNRYIQTPNAYNHITNVKGYLTGNDYLLGDYQGGMTLTRTNLITTDKELLNFMAKSSEIRFLLDENVNTKTNADSVKIITFTNDSITYHVNLSSKRCFVENEVFFPGWNGMILDKNTSTPQTVNSFAYKGALRGWCLPQGNYIFMEYFTPPYFSLLKYLLLFIIVFWLALMVFLPNKRFN